MDVEGQNVWKKKKWEKVKIGRKSMKNEHSARRTGNEKKKKKTKNKMEVQGHRETTEKRKKKL